MTDLSGLDLREPVRVVANPKRNFPLGKLASNEGIARNRGRRVDSHVRVLRDGQKQWETWHRSFWSLAQ